VELYIHRPHTALCLPQTRAAFRSADEAKFHTHTHTTGLAKVCCWVVNWHNNLRATLYSLQQTLSQAVCRSLNHLTPNGHYMGRTAQLTSRRYILNIYSTNRRTDYFKHAA